MNKQGQPYGPLHRKQPGAGAVLGAFGLILLLNLLWIAAVVGVIVLVIKTLT